jgi:phosphoribosylformylglycinamidine cyclo-ligase
VSEADPSASGLTYAEVGVDYDQLDPAKIMAQKAAAATAGQLERFGVHEVAASRGESAYVWEEPDRYRAFVVEGLGTKSLVGDATRPFSGRSHYDQLAQDTVAMIVNDVIVVGAAPQVVNAYWAVADGAWFEDRERAADLVRGWAAACEAAGATWGGGETPALKGVIQPGTIDLGGACVGVVEPKERLVLGDRLQAGDHIVLVAASGIHANGLTLARHLADTLPKGYGTRLDDGTTYGESLLEPTPIYARMLAEVFDTGAEVRYLVNVTGHGWRKLMRARRELRYRMHSTVPVPPVLDFITRQGDMSPDEAYATLNMGAGFAVFVPEEHVDTVISAADRKGLGAWAAGVVEEGPREVVIEPLGLRYAGDRLGVR